LYDKIMAMKSGNAPVQQPQANEHNHG
jgi:hypothetical protein